MHQTSLLLLSPLLVTACVVEAPELVGTSDEEIVNGSVDPNHWQVVKIRPVANPPPGQSVEYCTGTLVASRMVLTAGHCLFDGAAFYGAMQVLVTQREYDYEMHMWFSYQEWVTGTGASFPTYNPAVDPYIDNTGPDVAVIYLDWGVAGVTPAKLATSIYNGLPLTVVGFGATDSNGSNYGTSKRFGFNNLDSFDAKDFYFTSTGGEASTCYGDSGGPAFGGGYSSNCIAGITKGMVPYSGTACLNATMRDTRVDAGASAVNSWIKNQATAIGQTVYSCVP